MQEKSRSSNLAFRRYHSPDARILDIAVNASQVELYFAVTIQFNENWHRLNALQTPKTMRSNATLYGWWVTSVKSATK